MFSRALDFSENVEDLAGRIRHPNDNVRLVNKPREFVGLLHLHFGDGQARGTVWPMSDRVMVRGKQCKRRLNLLSSPDHKIQGICLPDVLQKSAVVLSIVHADSRDPSTI